MYLALLIKTDPLIKCDLSCRADRNDYIDVAEEWKSHKDYQFRDNSFTDNTPYDYLSILHYPATDYAGSVCIVHEYNRLKRQMMKLRWDSH